VKIADLQILFYAIDPTSDHHESAARWLEDAVNAREEFGLAWPTIHQFLRLGTNPAFPGCMSDEEAIGWVAEWLDAGVQPVSDSDVSWDLFIELVAASARLLRNAIDDAHLAAIAISRGATLASFDDDFGVFASHGLRWEFLGNDRS
jgi:toxin-antitoxin system PIN domain toxin